MKEYEPTTKQEQTIREYLHEAVIPLIEDVLVKKLGQAISFCSKELKSAEAEKQKPVLWAENLTDPQPHAVTDLKYCSVAQHKSGEDLKYIPLYTAPQQRKPLNKQQRIEIIESLEFENSQQELIDAVEAAHGIKENT